MRIYYFFQLFFLKKKALTLQMWGGESLAVMVGRDRSYPGTEKGDLCLPSSDVHGARNTAKVYRGYAIWLSPFLLLLSLSLFAIGKRKKFDSICVCVTLSLLMYIRVTVANTNCALRGYVYNIRTARLCGTTAAAKVVGKRMMTSHTAI
jgi:hypothetical protein